MAEPDFRALWKRAQSEFKLKGTLHGPSHWHRVEANGALLATKNGADLLVVRLFAIFHDCKRQNDDDDPDHGRRAATFLTEHRAQLFDISDDQFALLHEAVADHADGITHQNITIGTCWDADRLDLPRCGITPAPQFLSTQAARDEAASKKPRFRWPL